MAEAHHIHPADPLHTETVHTHLEEVVVRIQRPHHSFPVEAVETVDRSLPVAEADRSRQVRRIDLVLVEEGCIAMCFDEEARIGYLVGHRTEPVLEGGLSFRLWCRRTSRWLRGVVSSAVMLISYKRVAGKADLRTQSCGVKLTGGFALAISADSFS